MSKKKAPQIDPSQAVNAQLQAQREALAFQEKYTPLNTDTDLGVFGGTKQTYDPTTRTTSSKATYNPLIEQGLNEALQQGVNFDDLLKTEQQRVQDIYQKPFEEQTRRDVENLFGELGPAGRYSSRGSNVLAKTIAEQNKQRTVNNYELGQQAENNLFNRIVNKFNLFYRPTEVLSGMANPTLTTQAVTNAGQSGANIISQTGRGVADTYNSANAANLQAKMQASNKPSIWETLGGFALNTGANIALKRFGGG